MKAHISIPLLLSIVKKLCYLKREQICKLKLIKADWLILTQNLTISNAAATFLFSFSAHPSEQLH